MIKKVKIEDFNYPLPDGKIALYPANQRDASKLLVYKNNCISDSYFNKISDFLPDNTALFYNDTKVVHARLIFYKETSARIELFCLEPAESDNIAIELAKTRHVKWECLIGNSRRWASGQLTKTTNINGEDVTVTAERINVLSDCSIISFSWNADISFAEVLEHLGKVPLPPYIHRESDNNDSTRYQTVFAEAEGSVAAPTAGLHFTPKLISELNAKGIETTPLTLHVGAGTFKPVSSVFINDHNMHAERISVTVDTLEKLHDDIGNKFIIPVGTTTCRTLESLYWFGIMLSKNPNLNGVLSLDQWYPYQETTPQNINAKESINTILKWLSDNNLTSFEGFTSLMITPFYKLRIPDAIITNFHQPKSTLLLLISAFVGENWHKIYEHALNNDYRFLSYGDSCLFFKI